jgi:hypothetical protein
MDRFEIGLVTAFLTFAAYIAFDIWRSRQCSYCRAARQALKNAHPDWIVTGGCTHRAIEAGRIVVAIFYQDSKLRSRPLPYQLFGVSRDCTGVEESATDPSSPYWINGRK